MAKSNLPHQVAAIVHDGETAVVTPLGPYAAAYETGPLEKLSELLNHLVEHEGCRDLRLDLTHLNYTCAIFRGMLVRLHKELAKRGGRLMAYNLSPLVYDQFRKVHLTKLLDLRQVDPNGEKSH